MRRAGEELNLETIAFKPSAPLSLGVELELQLVNTRDCDLTRAASDMLALIEKEPHAGEIKPEITESMIEVSTGIHSRHDTLLAELREIRATVVAAVRPAQRARCAAAARIRSSTGATGASSIARASSISRSSTATCAKQFTVFGQHIHVGCADGDDALPAACDLALPAAVHRAARRPRPIYQGVDTAFDSSRLNAVFAFPLSGRAPFAPQVERIHQRTSERHERVGDRREHEGLLLGRAPEARVRDDRDPGLRHAAHRRARGGARRVCAGDLPLAAGRAP